MARISPIQLTEEPGQNDLNSEELLRVLARLDGIRQQHGSVANIFKTMANSPAALDAFLSFSQALSSSVLNPDIREQIAMTVAGLNECDYCASAHSLMAKTAGVSRDEVNLNLIGRSQDEKTQTILNLVSAIVLKRGNVSDSVIKAAQSAGVSDRQIIEIIAVVAINQFTNNLNLIAKTDIDFPLVKTSESSNAA